MGEAGRRFSLHEVKQSGYRIPVATAIAAGDAAAAESKVREQMRAEVDAFERRLRRQSPEQSKNKAARGAVAGKTGKPASGRRPAATSARRGAR